MSETSPPPAGWYPDPKPADAARPGERWWNGSEWTVSTRSDATTVFISGELPPKPRPRRRGPLLVGVTAAVLGLGVGSLATFLAMDHGDTKSATAVTRPNGNGGGGNGGDGLNPFGGAGGNGSGGGSGGNGGSGNGSGGGTLSGLVVGLTDGVSFPLPSGWTGGTTKTGHGVATFGSYTCPGATSGSGDTCSLAGANTTTLTAPVGTGVQAAAEADISAAVKESYGDVTGHQVLLTKSVTVAGRQGYLVRWQVDAKTGNNGTVETVVFPNKAGDKLLALHLGFDIATKAPALSVMDQIVSGVADFSASSLNGGTTGTLPGTS
ncbi:DUF2510 domain-containing protein [Streptacidiphilus rugosus]|uniref:DUF2510 domain-containing protein n=1 Tax=Streptacidiphilus rugosus TaxID=405783 RepID=UPI0005696D77|nr:DUF2510 domain-containing protein [Streptacidiphilus rugosus]